MPLASITRLRLRSWRFVPGFVWYAARSQRQARRAAGCLGVTTRSTGSLTFWTLSVWCSEHDMADFRKAPPHRDAMRRLAHWCDEAAVTHWTQDDESLPEWTAATAHLRERPRWVRVDHPSADQLAGIARF
jgi:heme-degrading monooxygenase HmoA